MDNHPEHETACTTQYYKACLNNVEYKYSANHRRMSISKPKYVPHSNIFPSAKASGFIQSSFDWHDLSTGNEQNLTPSRVAEMTPRQSDHAAHLLTATRLYLYSLPELRKNWGQINPNLDDYHSDSIEIHTTFWLPDITDC